MQQQNNFNDFLFHHQISELPPAYSPRTQTTETNPNDVIAPNSTLHSVNTINNNQCSTKSTDTVDTNNTVHI